VLDGDHDAAHPGLESHLLPNTVMTDCEGRVVREVSITPVRVDQPPFPLPTGVYVPTYFTIQPGGAYVAVKGYGTGRTGAWLVYPNYSQLAAAAVAGAEGAGVRLASGRVRVRQRQGRPHGQQVPTRWTSRSSQVKHPEGRSEACQSAPSSE
jgi:hypothetical protein